MAALELTIDEDAHEIAPSVAYQIDSQFITQPYHNCLVKLQSYR